MTRPDPRILQFIREHHVLTLAITRNDTPWCATCFYLFLEDRNLLVFTSGEETRHITDMTETLNFSAAGTIALETKMIGKIRGIQFSGIVRKLEGDELRLAKKAYLKRFPVARFSDLTLWGLEVHYIKMTDNRLGFGKKLIWENLPPRGPEP
jgi:uncharacterized protein YhbP (UPF0306 family)